MRLTLILIAIATAFAIAGCGANEDTGSASAETVATIPAPDDGEAAALLAALTKVEPGLGIEDSIDNARNTCTSILGGVAPGDLIKSTKTRFEGDGIDTLTVAQARQVIGLIRDSAWCK